MWNWGIEWIGGVGGHGADCQGKGCAGVPAGAAPAVLGTVSVAGCRQVSDKVSYTTVIGGDHLTVVDFYATWCGPCVRIAPVYEAMSVSPGNKGVVFLNIDVDKNDTGDETNCMPTFKFYKSGKLLHTIEGADDAAIQAAITLHKGD